MKKHELVFLHSLLVVVREVLEQRGEVPEGTFDTYDALGVPAAAINRRKADHQEAVRLLLDGIVTAIEPTSGADGAQQVAADG